MIEKYKARKFPKQNKKDSSQKQAIMNVIKYIRIINLIYSLRRHESNKNFLTLLNLH